MLPVISIRPLAATPSSTRSHSLHVCPLCTTISMFALCAPLSRCLPSVHHYLVVCPLCTTISLFALCAPLSRCLPSVYHYLDVCPLCTTISMFALCVPLSRCLPSVHHYLVVCPLCTTISMFALCAPSRSSEHVYLPTVAVGRCFDCRVCRTCSTSKRRIRVAASTGGLVTGGYLCSRLVLQDATEASDSCTFAAFAPGTACIEYVQLYAWSVCLSILMMQYSLLQYMGQCASCMRLVSYLWM